MTTSAEVSQPLSMSYDGWKMPHHPVMQKHRQMAFDFLDGDHKLYALWGSVSSGKTVTSAQAWAAFVERTPKHYPLAMIGKTERTLEANVLDPLAEFLGSKYSENRGRGIVYLYDRKIRIYGANDSKSESKIRGKTLYAWYGDEVTTWPESFFMMALSRLRIPGAKAIMTMNPENPNHWFHRQIVERADDPGIRAKLYHFTMEDNPHLSDEYKAWIKSMYAPGTIWYRRWVEGLWVAAEGRVFQFFDPSPDADYVVSTLPDHFTMYLVGADYGTANPFAATLWGLSGGVWYIIREFYWDSVIQRKQKTNPEYIEDIARLCYWNGSPVAAKILVPPEEAGFIREIKQSKYQHLSHVRAADNSIMPGLEDISTLFATGKLKVYEKCEKTIWGFNDLLWDQRQQERGIDMYIKGGSGSPDHICDGNRYAAREAAKQLRQMRIL